MNMQEAIEKLRAMLERYEHEHRGLGPGHGGSREVSGLGGER